MHLYYIEVFYFFIFLSQTTKPTKAYADLVNLLIQVNAKLNIKDKKVKPHFFMLYHLQKVVKIMMWLKNLLKRN